MLFFDLVYVFLITELNGVLREEAGWHGIIHCAVLLALIYWQWVLVTVQSSIRDASTIRHRFVVMLLMLIAMISAVALPQAFGERSLLFAITCWTSRLVITFLLARSENSNAFRMDLTSSLVQGPLLIGGALLGGTGQLVLWALAALSEITAPFLHSRTMRTQRYDVGNVVERFSLLIIVALGETIVSIVTPQADLEALMEHYISRARTPFFGVRSLLAYGHLALAAGLISLAAGLHHIMEEPHHHVPMESAVLLCGGVVVFLAMFAVMRLRNARRIYRSRVVASLLCILLIPMGTHTSGLLLVVLLAVVAVAECVWETIAPRSAGVPEHEELAHLAAAS